jgi:hypothetical protein
VKKNCATGSDLSGCLTNASHRVGASWVRPVSTHNSSNWSTELEHWYHPFPTPLDTRSTTLGDYHVHGLLAPRASDPMRPRRQRRPQTNPSLRLHLPPGHPSTGGAEFRKALSTRGFTWTVGVPCIQKVNRLEVRVLVRHLEVELRVRCSRCGRWWCVLDDFP